MILLKIICGILLLFLLGGCSAHNIHVNNLKEKNESLYDVFKDAKTVLKIDRTSPKYEIFKKTFMGNENFIASKKVKECSNKGFTYCCYTAESKHNTFDKYKECLGSQYYEPVYTTSLDIESAMAAKTRMDIAKTTCHYMKGYNPDLDYSTCVKEQYEPKAPKVNTSMNGIVLRVNESGVYGTIRRNLEEKKLMFSPYERILTYYDLFTEHKIGIIEVDEKNAEIIVSSRGSTHIKSTYEADVKAITANIVTLLESLNIEYEYAR